MYEWKFDKKEWKKKSAETQQTEAQYRFLFIT